MADLSWLTARPVAHRGLHDSNKAVWENTLSAFQRAVDRNFSIECDVHLSSDGQVVVIHDGDLKRLTGTDGFVWQRTAAELGALKVGGTDDHVPTLKEMLDLVDGRVALVIELKGIPGHDSGLVRAVGELLKTYRGKAAIMSFDHWLVRDFARDAPGIAAGLTAWGDQLHDVEAHFSMLAHPLDFVSYGVDVLDNRFIEMVRDRLGMKVITWTVRTPEQVQKTFARAHQMTFEGFDPDATPTA